MAAPRRSPDQPGRMPHGAASQWPFSLPAVPTRSASAICWRRAALSPAAARRAGYRTPRRSRPGRMTPTPGAACVWRHFDLVPGITLAGRDTALRRVRIRTDAGMGASTRGLATDPPAANMIDAFLGLALTWRARDDGAEIRCAIRAPGWRRRSVGASSWALVAPRAGRPRASRGPWCAAAACPHPCATARRAGGCRHAPLPLERPRPRCAGL